MIIRNGEHKIDVVPGPFEGGCGSVSFKRIIETPEELCGKGRVFSVVTLEKDCGLGFHTHNGDVEYYLMLSGEAEYSDNGEQTVLRAGDTSFCGDGEGHAIVNRRDEPVVLVALIIYT
ncbi:MAG: cupin domain-containing protein [Oscillospiraceae bacterium]|nr:cupin domain-containing protein [Oscillospiraceae bacterium]